MKKVLSMMLAMCLTIALLPGMAVHARAAGGPEKALQTIYYCDVGREELLDESTTGVLVKNGSTNLVITVFPSKEDQGIYTVFTIENSNSADFCYFSQSWNQVFSIYTADSEYGEADGFTKQGVVTEGETVYLVLGWDQDGNKGGYKTTATGYKDGRISLKDSSGSIEYPIPVLNSKNEVCAVFYNEYCYSLITDEETFYANSKPAETEPPATEAPAETAPPVTEVPAETTPSDAEVSGKERAEEYSLPVDLPELDELYANAVTQKKPSNTGVIATACIGVLVIILLAAVVIVRRKNKLKVNEDLNEAEEGTQLVNELADTGLRLQFCNGKRIAVKRSFTIGRAPDNDVVIPRNSTSVSGHHCEIVIQNSTVYLRDMGSTNGTFINGRRVPVGQLVQLNPGMTVSLGGTGSAEAFTVVLSSRPM